MSGKPNGRGASPQLGELVQLGANFAVALVALLKGLGPWQLLLVYWLECLWIGLFNAARILFASAFSRPWDTDNVGVSRGAGLLLSLLLLGFFGAKYLAFLGGIGVVLLVIPTESGWADVHELIGDQAPMVALCSGILVLGHSADFILEFLLGGGFRRARPLALLFRPYLRCLGFLVSLAVAATVVWLLPQLANTTAFALVVIAVKAGMDLVGGALDSRRTRAAVA